MYMCKKSFTFIVIGYIFCTSFENKTPRNTNKKIAHMQKCDFFRFIAIYNVAITSISTNPPFGNAATATAERAGNGAVKRVE